MQTVIKKSLSAVLALWAAWRLGGLAGDICSGLSTERLLQQEITEITQALADFEEPGAPSDRLKAMGYVYREDMVFFDGG